MSRYEDEDGIDGPWERALARSMREDAKQARKRTKWEHTTTSKLGVSPTPETFAALAKEGWELVAVEGSGGGSSCAYFKRRIEEVQP